MVDPNLLKERQKLFEKEKYFELTSSLNNHFICDKCNKLYSTKGAVKKHLSICDSDEKKCKWCNIYFKNRGNLISHTMKVHNNISKEPHASHIPSKRVKCNACDKDYNENWKLQMHIRRLHFNLMATTPNCDTKKVNQVWFEKVINTDTVMEIKKTGQNVLVMRKLGPNTAIKIHDTERPVIDLSNLYRTSKTEEKVKCDWCSKKFMKRCLSKHIEEKHLSVYKHQCNNCNRSFKRHYLFVRHVCFKVRTRRRSTMHLNDIRTKLNGGLPLKSNLEL